MHLADWHMQLLGYVRLHALGQVANFLLQIIQDHHRRARQLPILVNHLINLGFEFGHVKGVGELRGGCHGFSEYLCRSIMFVKKVSIVYSMSHYRSIPADEEDKNRGINTLKRWHAQSIECSPPPGQFQLHLKIHPNHAHLRLESDDGPSAVESAAWLFHRR